MNSNIHKWLILNKVPNLGTAGIKKLWDHFGSIDKIFAADKKALFQVEGLSTRAINSLLEKNSSIEVGPHWPEGVKLSTFSDDKYPKILASIYDPPSILYYKGELPTQNERAIAIVGTRKASRYGLETARRLAFELASLGFIIVSGLALGIDSAAHQGALDADGKTIAVLGCGIDVIYPHSNKKLYQLVSESTAVVSEFSPGTKAENWMFPRRNRIISGLSLGVIVVEGHYKSGAMITAKQALEQGREVFAVPGHIGFDQAKGPHWLIKQGAKLVETVEDVLEEFNLQVPNHPPAGRTGKHGKLITEDLSSEEQRVIKCLSLEPKHIDLISMATGFGIAQTSSLLMMLELKQVVEQLPGKLYVSRCAKISPVLWGLGRTE